METVRTVICKLAPTPEQSLDIEATLRAFASACDFAADAARRIGSTNKVKVQQDCYREIRERFGLSANLAIRAIARACAALKVPAKMHSAFAPTSIDFDVRIFSFHEWNWTFGLTLLSGRVKIATALGDRQKAMLKGCKPTAAVLVKRRDGKLFLHVQLTDEAPDPIPFRGHVGVDLGSKNLAVTDDGETFSGDRVEAVRRRYKRLRQTCQRAGTKSAKRKLSKVRRKESSFRKDVSHKISKGIVAKAKGTGKAIAVEELTGIRDRTTAKGRDARSRQHGWAFHQLRQFIAYKAAFAGVALTVIDPAYTSQTCSKCGHCEAKNRKTRDDFACRRCGFELPADWNAARNIRDRADVLRPNVGVDDSGSETRTRRLASPRL